MIEFCLEHFAILIEFENKFEHALQKVPNIFLNKSFPFIYDMSNIT